PVVNVGLLGAGLLVEVRVALEAADDPLDAVDGAGDRARAAVERDVLLEVGGDGARPRVAGVARRGAEVEDAGDLAGLEAERGQRARGVGGGGRADPALDEGVAEGVRVAPDLGGRAEAALREGRAELEEEVAEAGALAGREG